MDYVEWCDAVADALADFAEGQPNRWVNLQQFAGQFVAMRALPNQVSVTQAVLRAAVDVLRVLGVGGTSPAIQFKYADLSRLRDKYFRWLYAAAISLNPLELALLGTLNQLSQHELGDYASVEEVDLRQIVEAINADPAGAPLEADRAEEVLDALERFALARGVKWIGLTRYESSYLGVARLARARVAQDREIDALRCAGEGDTLDYKRHYKLDTDAEKWEFAKDVTALANAGGQGPRYLLLGVEDNGEFYRPGSADEERAHRALLDITTETRLQQIVTSRTTHSPSIRIAARGDHREGPYVLIEVSRDVGHLPYRVYRKQATRTAPNASASGEVWIRKGSTKSLATLAEIAALEHQARMFQKTRDPKGL